MKQIIFTVLLLIGSVVSFSQVPFGYKHVATLKRVDNTLDSFFTKYPNHDSVFSKNLTYVCPHPKVFQSQSDPNFPEGFEKIFKLGNNEYSNIIPFAENAERVRWDSIVGTPTTFTPSSHTHTVSELSDASTAGMSILGIANPASISFIRVNSNGTVVTRTVAESKQDLQLDNVTNESKATMFTSPIFTGTPTVPGYQPLATNLTSIGALTNGSGYLKNNGSGTFTYETPAGAGTVTNTGNLTANSVVLGNGTTDTKVVAGITTDGTSQLVLGVNTTTLGSVKMFGNTSGDVTIQPSAAAGTAVTFTLPSVSGTPLLNTATSGVGASPTASTTTTITHNLGRIPTIIRIYGLGGFTNNNSGVPQSQSTGLWTSSGNTCLFQRYDATAVTGAEPSETSTAFAIFIATSNGNFISGVIQNVTSTGFDIVWTETGTSAAQNYLWEAQ